jgi:hypothetical protein
VSVVLRIGHDLAAIARETTTLRIESSLAFGWQRYSAHA